MIRSRHSSPHEASCSVCTSKIRLQNKGRTMLQQIVRASIRKSRIQHLFAATVTLIVIGVGSDLQAQMQCEGGRTGGRQMAGRAGGPGVAMGGGGVMGGGVNQMAQMMQMIQQAQQLQQMQRQAAMMQQAREQQQRQTRQQQALMVNQNATNSASPKSSASTKPTMTRRERLRLLIQQRREEKSLTRPSRRELAIQRSSRNRQSVTLASAQPAAANINK